MELRSYTAVFVGISFIFLLVQLIAGSLYAFGAISEGLKEKGFGHAVPVPLLGAAGNIGTFVSVYNGWLVDRCGPGISLALGGGLLGLGYSSLSAIVQMPSSDAREYAALAAFFVVGNGAVLSFLSAYTSAAAFVPLPHWVGRASGTVLGAYAGAAALCAFIFKTVLHNDLVEFFELLSLSSHVISGLGAFAVLYLSVKHAQYVAATAGDVALPEDDKVMGSSNEFKSLITDEAGTTAIKEAGEGLLGDPVSEEAEAVEQEHAGKCGAFRQNAGVLVRPAFVILWLIIFLGLGSALMFVNTISDVSAAVTAGHVAASSLTRDCVIAFALSNVAARVVGGTCSDFLAKRGFSRLWMLLAGSAVGVVGHLLIAFTPMPSSESALATWLVAASSVVGVSEGLLFLWPIAGREWFGAKKTGIFFTLLNSAVGVGSAVYTAAASGTLHKHSETTLSDQGVLVSHCEGSDCFRSSYIAAALSNAGAILLGLWVMRLLSRRPAGSALQDTAWPVSCNRKG